MGGDEGVWTGVVVGGEGVQGWLPPSPPGPTNALSRDISVRTVVFWDQIKWAPGLGTELIEYRTACPTNTPVWRSTYASGRSGVSFAGGRRMLRGWQTEPPLAAGTPFSGLLAIARRHSGPHTTARSPARGLRRLGGERRQGSWRG